MAAISIALICGCGVSFDLSVMATSELHVVPHMHHYQGSVTEGSSDCDVNILRFGDNVLRKSITIHRR